MLFGYPIAATANNWLHECVFAAVEGIHDFVERGRRLPAWPSILPAAYQHLLRSRSGLRERLDRYASVLKKLDATQRALILEELISQNRVADLLSGSCECRTSAELPETIRSAVEDLFTFAFDLLTDFNLRDVHYRAIYSACPNHVCPFCGTENFDAPGAPREALDHYLVRTSYPFAAANLRNLVPMGPKCNSTYKLAKDLLRKEDGTRRVAVDPYVHVGLKLTLDNSDPFGGSAEQTPRWDIAFSLSGASVETWIEVFRVRERYGRDHLDPSYDGWVGLFAQYARMKGVNPGVPSEIVTALANMEDLFSFEGFKDRAFLKVAVYRMLRLHCERGHIRLLALLADAVRASQLVA